MIFEPEDGSETKTWEVCKYPNGGGCGMGMFNENESINGFAKACFEYAL